MFVLNILYFAKLPGHLRKPVTSRSRSPFYGATIDSPMHFLEQMLRRQRPIFEAQKIKKI